MEKVQLSFNCRTAGERVIERSTLVNIRTDSVDEATQLYQELMAKLGAGAIISEHQHLPQVPTRQSVRLPVTVRPAIVHAEQTVTKLCPEHNVPLQKKTCRRGKNEGREFYGCPYYVRGCLHFEWA